MTMEYPKLLEAEKRRIADETAKIPKLEAQIAEARRIYARHLELAERKGDAFHSFAAYTEAEDEDDRLEGEDEWSNPEEYRYYMGLIAQDVSSENKLRHTSDLISNKAGKITTLETSKDDLETSIKRRRGLLKAITRFNPSVTHAKQKGYLNHFVRIKPDEWLGANGRRRHRTDRQTNSRLKVTMDMFVRPEWRGLPKQTGEYEGIDYDDVSLDRVPFDPALIPDSFLDGLGWVVPNGHELDRLREKRKYIPAVKQLMEECVFPLNMSGSGKGDRMNYRLLVVSGHKQMNEGKIIVPRTNTEDDIYERHKEPSIFTSAYAVGRQAGHVTKNYEKESQIITSENSNLKALHKRLLKLKKHNPDYETERNKIKEGLGGIVDTLTGSITFYKRVAYEALSCAANLKDKLGRDNFGASLARLVKVMDRLEKRLDESFDTSLAFPENAKTIDAVIYNGENTIEQYGQAFTEYIESGSISRFGGLVDTLQELRVRPFNLYAQRIEDFIKVMNQHRGKPELRKIAAIKGLAVTRLFAVQKGVENVLYKLGNDATDIDMAKIFMRQTKALAIGLAVGQYKSIFNKVVAHIEEIEAEEHETTKKIKTHLKELNFEELLNQIK